MDGVGKKTTALRFAMAANCQAQDHDGSAVDTRCTESLLACCGQCPSCKKIKAGAHPDVLLMIPGGTAIRIDQVRSLCGQLAMKPYEARRRFAIISDAQAMNIEAANALLKVLEEPPDRTILILTADQASDLLPTIVSRCQIIRFHPISRTVLAEHLKTCGSLSAEEAAARASLANGSFARAFDPKLEEWMPRRLWLIKQAATLPSASNSARLAFAEALAKDKSRLEDALEILKLWFRDLLVWRYDPNRIVNTDLAGQLWPAARVETALGLLAKIKGIGAAQQAIAGNANARLVMETLVRRLAAPDASP